MIQSEWQDILCLYVPSAQKQENSVCLFSGTRPVLFSEPLSLVALLAARWPGHCEILTPWNGPSDLEGLQIYAQWALDALVSERARFAAFDFLDGKGLLPSAIDDSAARHSAFQLCKCLFAYLMRPTERRAIWQDVEQLISKTCTRDLGIDERLRAANSAIARAFIDTHAIALANLLSTRCVGTLDALDTIRQLSKKLEQQPAADQDN